MLYSYNKCGVTIWDHHTASESFMQFYSGEIKTRGGCPADWIWLVPPMSSSTSPLFHQEMTFYFLKPSFEYQVISTIRYVSSIPTMCLSAGSVVGLQDKQSTKCSCSRHTKEDENSGNRCPFLHVFVPRSLVEAPQNSRIVCISIWKSRKIRDYSLF